MPFQYLSFQRSPSAQLHYGQQLFISPLITNDLREAKFIPNDHEYLLIEIAWVRLDHAGDWMVVKKEEEVRWSGEESAWKKVSIVAPSMEEMEVTPGEAEVGRHGRMDSVRLAMWVSSRLASPMNNARSKKPSRPMKKLKMESRNEDSSKDLTAKLAVFPIEAALRASRYSEDVFLPVLTPPIKLCNIDETASSSSGNSFQKFTEIARLWHVPSSWTDSDLKGESRYLEIREELGYQLDRHVWDASLALMASLLENSLDRLHSKKRPRRSYDGPHPQSLLTSSKRGCVTVELGAGTGLLSLWIEKIWESSSLASVENDSNQDSWAKPESKCFVTDLQESLALAASNASLNSSPLQPDERLDKPQSRILGLDWFSASLPHELEEAIQGGYTSDSEDQEVTAEGSRKVREAPHLLVLASDCSYNPDAYPALASTIKRLLTAQPCEDRMKLEGFEAGQREAMCVLAKKHRNRDEQSLWDAFAKENLRVYLHQGWHDDYTSHADIAQTSDVIRGSAQATAMEDEAMGRWGVYFILPPKGKGS